MQLLRVLLLYVSIGYGFALLFFLVIVASICKRNNGYCLVTMFCFQFVLVLLSICASFCSGSFSTSKMAD